MSFLSMKMPPATEVLRLDEELAVLIEQLQPDRCRDRRRTGARANRRPGLCGVQELAGPEPSLPNDLMNLPSLVNFEMRATVSGGALLF